jgi:hypothetical protein
MVWTEEHFSKNWVLLASPPTNSLNKPVYTSTELSSLSTIYRCSAPSTCSVFSSSGWLTRFVSDSGVCLPFVNMGQHPEYETTADSGIHQRGTQVTKETSVVFEKTSELNTRQGFRFVL